MEEVDVMLEREGSAEDVDKASQSPVTLNILRVPYLRHGAATAC